MVQYRVFIAPPGGLQKERKCFRDKLAWYSQLHAEPRGVSFFPVGWEDTAPGIGRPQEQINEDLRQCDFAVFVFHDRWGTPTGSGHTSGTDEEWAIANEQYHKASMLNIALYFKDVAQAQLRDPGEQLRKVLDFKKKIADEKRHLFGAFGSLKQFGDELEKLLKYWLEEHERRASGAAGPALSAGRATPAPAAAASAPPPADPGYDFWISEAEKLTDAVPPDYVSALFCAKRALAAAGSDEAWARAAHAVGAAQFFLGRYDQALTSLDEIIDKFASATGAQARELVAKALVNKGRTLGALGRSGDEIAVYDAVVARFGTATEPALREQVARALVNKQYKLCLLGRNADAVAVDEELARYGTTTEPAQREIVECAKTLNEGGGASSGD